MHEVPESVYSEERPRLVSLCYRLTGNLDAAEDLAQETLFEAWRNERKLHDRSGYSRWLSAIARNVCMRWARQRGRDHVQLPQLSQEFDYAALEDPFDLDVELDRRDLVDLLDRAMALLPSDTRELLVERYVRESPYAEIAPRLGLDENAAIKRVERGRLQLKRVLTSDLRHEAAMHGLTTTDADGWQQTRIWCPVCGERALVGRFTDDRELQLDCVGCLGMPRSVVARGDVSELLEGVKPADVVQGVKGYKRALGRQMGEFHRFFKEGIEERTAQCSWCGSDAPLCVGDPNGLLHYVATDCPHCGRVREIGSVSFLALATPEGQLFWRAHKRIRTLPEVEVEAAGVPAIVASLEGAADGARFEVVFARDTLEFVGGTARG